MELCRIILFSSYTVVFVSSNELDVCQSDGGFEDIMRIRSRADMR